MKKGWIIVDFDCYRGCNNPEFNPGCDESSIRIKINGEIDEKFKLFAKYMQKLACPRCGKIAGQKRSGWWLAGSNKTKLIDYDNSVFFPSDVQDYTKELLEAKEVELEEELRYREEYIDTLKAKIESIKKVKYKNQQFKKEIHKGGKKE